MGDFERVAFGVTLHSRIVRNIFTAGVVLKQCPLHSHDRFLILVTTKFVWAICTLYSDRRDEVEMTQFTRQLSHRGH